MSLKKVVPSCLAGGSSRNQKSCCALLSRSVLSRVRLFVTPRTAALQAPPSTGILQARVLEWDAMPSSRGSSQPRDRTQVSRVAGRSLTV